MFVEEVTGRRVPVVELAELGPVRLLGSGRVDFRKFGGLVGIVSLYFRYQEVLR